MSLFSKIVDVAKKVTKFQIDQVKQGAQTQIQNYIGDKIGLPPAAAGSLSRVAVGLEGASNGVINFDKIQQDTRAMLSSKLSQSSRNASAVAMPQRDVIVGPGGGGMSLPPGYTSRPTLGVMGAVIGVVRSVTGKIIAFVTGAGLRVTRKKAVQLAKEYGPTAAAAALGVTAADIMEAIITETQTKRRRRRGITARDLTTTKRTMNTLKRMSEDVGIRRRTCRR